MDDGPSSAPVTVQESFDCVRDCQASTGEWDSSIRSARGCGLSYGDMPPVRRLPTADALLQCRVRGVVHGSYYRGRLPDRRLIGTSIFGVPITEQNYRKPPEDPAIGCPRAHYSTAFIDDVDAHLRRRTRDGGRVPNPRFDQADWLMQSAVLYFEGEQERYVAHVEDVQRKRIETERAKPPTTPRRGR